LTTESEGALRHLVDNPAFPRSSGYDPLWVAEDIMGPNVLWLAEAQSQVLEFRPEQRVLDLGCGRALSSIFLAKEFGAQVWAGSLWINASENLRRIEAAGVADRVYPIFVEAHQLPFGHGFFDLVVALDSYHYFGTDDCYIGYMTRSLKPEGRLAIVVPGGPQELEDAPELRKVVNWDMWSFHGPEWWRSHWRRSGLVEVEHADLVPDGWRHWLASERATGFTETMPAWAAALEAEAGRTFGFSRVVARKLPVDQVWRPVWP
jgi:cyclopropane fatty-acyl-phospholipid synthase-like methyltransferase